MVRASVRFMNKVVAYVELDPETAVSSVVDTVRQAVKAAADAVAATDILQPGFDNYRVLFNDKELSDDSDQPATMLRGSFDPVVSVVAKRWSLELHKLLGGKLLKTCLFGVQFCDANHVGATGIFSRV
jgi:hypothetical protein